MPNHSIQEYLVYDFSVNVNDILSGIYVEDNAMIVDDITVTHVDSVLENGVYIRTITLDNEPGQWVEGVGCSLGLFKEYWGKVSEYELQRYCMSANNKSRYPNAGNEACSTVNTIHQYGSELSMIAYPNPSKNGEFLLQFSNVQNVNMEQALVTNSIGQKVPFTISKLNKQSITLKIQTSIPGVYYAKFHTDEMQHNITLVVK